MKFQDESRRTGKLKLFKNLSLLLNKTFLRNSCFKPVIGVMKGFTFREIWLILATLGFYLTVLEMLH